MDLAVRQQLLIASLACLPGLAFGEWLDWSAEAEVALGSDDNVNMAVDDFEQDDESLAITARLGRSMLLDSAEHANTRLRLSADISREYYNDWDDLTHTRIGAVFQLQHKTGLGMTAPRLSASLSANYEDVRDSYRDAWHYSALLGIDKRLGPRLDLGIAAYYRFRDGEEWTEATTELGSKVYNSDHGGLTVSARYSLLPRLRLSASASYYDGEFDSDCADLLSPGGGNAYGGGLANLGREPIWKQFGVKAIAADQVFACRWLADGDGYGLHSDLVWSLSRASNVKLRLAYREIEMDFGEDYSNTSLGLSYRYRF
ncbi:MAG: hypothetical protein ABJ308_04245 [Halieaceae bacterium]